MDPGLRRDDTEGLGRVLFFPPAPWGRVEKFERSEKFFGEGFSVVGRWRAIDYTLKFHAYPSPNGLQPFDSPSRGSGRSRLAKVHRTFAFAHAKRLSPPKGRVGRELQMLRTIALAERTNGSRATLILKEGPGMTQNVWRVAGYAPRFHAYPSPNGLRPFDPPAGGGWD